MDTRKKNKKQHIQLREKPNKHQTTYNSSKASRQLQEMGYGCICLENQSNTREHEVSVLCVMRVKFTSQNKANFPKL